MYGNLKTLSCVTAIGRACNAARLHRWTSPHPDRALRIGKCCWRAKSCGQVALRAGSFVFLFGLASATAADKTMWEEYNNVAETNSDTTSTDGRIPLGSNLKGDDNFVYEPAVIKDGSTNRMWYTGRDGTWYRIYYATSLDGLTWTKYDNNIPDDSDSICTNGTIARGSGGTGDSGGVRCPAVIKDGATYKMWYSGHDGSKWRIYYATSPDGMTWTKYSNSVPDASNTTGTYGRIPLGISGGDTKSAYLPAVIKDGSTYKMWYTGNDGTNARIYHATSPDGLTWTKYTNAVPGNTNTTSTLGRIPLGTGAGKGDTNWVVAPAVIKAGSTYKMWYSGHDKFNYRIYYAFSTDGLTWTKYDNSIPAVSDTTSSNGCVPLGQSGGDINGALCPSVIKDGYFYKMWYAGYDGSNYRIYHALLDALPEGLIFYSY